MEKIIKKLRIRVKGKVEEERRVEEGKREKGEMVIVRMATKKSEREIMENKWG